MAQVGHWEQSRWSADGHADTVYALVQRLADRAADAEGGPRRTVPRLPDHALPDQVRVLTADLLAAGPSADTLAAAVEDIAAVRHAL